MKQSKSMRIWNILYPIGIYYVLTTITLFILDFILPETVDSKLLRQLLTSVVSFPFLYSFYRQDQKMRGKMEVSVDFQVKYLWIFLIGGCFAVAWNNLLGMIHIADYSAGYSHVTETFYTGRLLLEIVALCIVIPIVEELLYRGIVYERIRDWLGIKTAIVASAVIFGLVHMNLVQFVYAAIFGLLLAYFVEITGNLAGATAAHMAANLTSVLRAETNVFAFLDQSPVLQITVTLALFFMVFLWVKNSK